MIVDSFPDRCISVKGEKYLYFGGTSYLGMSTLPAFQKVLLESLSKWGTSYGSSRNSNIKLSIYEKFEKYFSYIVGSEASLSISSGMLAGRFTIDYLSNTIKTFYHYPKTHPAILAQNSLALFENGKLHPRLLNNIPEEIVITADAILSLKVKPTSFDFLKEVSSNKKITLVLDESHSLGIVGKKGEGIFNCISNKFVKRKIMVSSLGKALGLTVGIIASDKEFIQNLKNEPIFISASATNPAYLETFINSQTTYERQRIKLRSNLDFVNSKLNCTKSIKFDNSYPVIYCNDEFIFSELLTNNIIISKFRYPTYDNYLNRIVITANHTKNDLQKLTQILNKYYDN